MLRIVRTCLVVAAAATGCLVALPAVAPAAECTDQPSCYVTDARDMAVGILGDVLDDQCVYAKFDENWRPTHIRYDDRGWGESHPRPQYWHCRYCAPIPFRRLPGEPSPTPAEGLAVGPGVYSYGPVEKADPLLPSALMADYPCEQMRVMLPGLPDHWI